jgi:hypothetical protein
MKHRIFAKLALFALAVVAFSPFGWAQSKVAGDWAGVLSVDGSQMHIALHIFEGKDGSLTATADNIDQGQYAIPVTTTTFKDSKLTFTVESHQVAFEGVLNNEGTEIDGKMVQQGQSMEMELKLQRIQAQAVAFSIVVDRLSGMHELPDGAWKIHTGDMAHGERVNLDESDWKPVARDAKLGADSVWFRQTYQIPETLKGYNLTGARVWFQLNVDADNAHVTQIIYMNGKRAAMGEDLEPMALFEDAKPGDKVTVAVKVLATPGEKTFQGATLRIDFPDKALSPEDLRQELLSAKQLIPSLAPGDTASMAALDTAVSAIDLKALDAHDQARGSEAADEAEHRHPERPVAHRRSLAVALDGNRGRGAAHLRHFAATDARVPHLYLHAVVRGLQRVDGAEVSLHECRNRQAHQGRALGGCGRHVGRAGPEPARRRVAGAPVAGGQALVQAGLRHGCADWLESGLVRLQLAVAADLQEERRGLLCDHQAELERHKSVAALAVLVGVA